jgi:4-amino-4-deoxy-L-arabinose transferase-like glycosyltransferase
LFGATLAISKVVTALFGMLTLLVVYLIGKKFGWVTSLSSTAILLSIPLFTHLMMISYVDIPIAFFAALALYFFLQPSSTKNSIITGVILAMSFYAKSSGLFLVVGFFLYSIARYFYKKDVNLKLAFITCIVFAILISPWVIKNLIFYKYPYLEGINIFFKLPIDYPSWITQALATLSPSINYYENFGYISLILVIFGAIYALQVKEEKLYLPIFLLILFILLFYLRPLISVAIEEPRYFSIIFPYIAIIGAFFLNGLYDKNKNFMFVIIAVILLSLYFSLSVALNTNSSQRYSQDYIQALQWLKSNTPSNANIFTAYEGSLRIFADRNDVWAMTEFPELMTTQNSTYIYDTLKKYNVDYILIWRGIVADKYVIPESNLIGAFTYNFVNMVSSDTKHFNATYQNQDNIIFKLT